MANEAESATLCYAGYELMQNMDARHSRPIRADWAFLEGLADLNSASNATN